jgi:pimeloyl-ACP methyl ester carboxylesterase
MLVSASIVRGDVVSTPDGTAGGRDPLPAGALHHEAAGVWLSGETAIGARPRPVYWYAAHARTNGIRLHYVSAGEGPLVLLCHGFPECWYSWRHQLAGLSDRWRVVAVDLRGYNLSDKPAAGYDVKTLTADLAGMVDALGASEAVIVGHDVGGILAWQFALDYPALTRAVVSLNTPFLPRPAVPYTRFLRLNPLTSYIVALQQQNAEAVIAADVFGFVERVFLTLARNPAAFPLPVLRRYAAALAMPGAVAAALGYYRSLDRSWELTAGDERRRIAAPALMLAADGDAIFPLASSAVIHERVPHAVRRVVPACGHWTQQERPELVNRLLRRFLSQASPGHS